MYDIIAILAEAKIREAIAPRRLVPDEFIKMNFIDTR